jgi:hypothetical protein
MSTYIPVITNKSDYEYPDLYVGNRKIGEFYACGQGFTDLMDELFAEFLRDKLKAHGIEFYSEDDEEFE